MRRESCSEVSGWRMSGVVGGSQFGRYQHSGITSRCSYISQSPKDEADIATPGRDIEQDM